MRLKRGNQTVKRDVLDFDFAPELFSQVPRQIDADAGGLALLVGHLKWRIGQFHADDQAVGRFWTAAGQQSDQSGAR